MKAMVRKNRLYTIRLPTTGEPPVDPKNYKEPIENGNDWIFEKFTVLDHGTLEQDDGYPLNHCINYTQ